MLWIFRTTVTKTDQKKHFWTKKINVHSFVVSVFAIHFTYPYRYMFPTHIVCLPPSITIHYKCFSLLCGWARLKVPTSRSHETVLNAYSVDAPFHCPGTRVFKYVYHSCVLGVGYETQNKNMLLYFYDYKTQLRRILRNASISEKIAEYLYGRLFNYS